MGPQKHYIWLQKWTAKCCFWKKNNKPCFSKFIKSCGIYIVGIIINMKPNIYDKAEVRTFAQTIDRPDDWSKIVLTLFYTETFNFPEVCLKFPIYRLWIDTTERLPTASYPLGAVHKLYRFIIGNLWPLPPPLVVFFIK